MATEFEAKLADFQAWVAQNAKPEFASAVDAIISANYTSQLGEATPATGTIDKLNSLVTSIGSTYLNSLSAYYLAKQKVADLKLASQGSWTTQVANAANNAASIPPSNLWLIGGLGVLAAVLLLRK